MPRDVRAYLWDIRYASDAIFRFLGDMDSKTYGRAELVSSAVERKFEIIGEALGQLAKLDPELAERIPDFKPIVAFRNLLIHGYAVVDSERVLRIARTSLPELRAAVDALLTELGTP
jgi:uncharacterized protein with HEPN domain